MIARLALRSLLARPVRSAVLSCGFGFGIAVMAALLGVGEVILEQSRAPALRGGGDLLVTTPSARLSSARYVLSSLMASEPFDGRVRAVAPSAAGTLYLLGKNGATGVRVRAGIPSLDRQLDDPEVAQVPAWTDPAAAREWTRPDPAAILRGMDRFHPIPEGSDWSDSWAEWLYFNGSRPDGSARFYLTFLVGPRRAAGRRDAGVRLQLERDGTIESFARWGEVAEAEVLETAPDLSIAGSRVRLVGLDYHMHLALDSEDAPSGAPELEGDLVLRAVAGRSVPPIVLRGTRGWVSGYVVPVLSGSLTGALRVRGTALAFDAGRGYHDHNWGFWEGVTWKWGQVAHADLAIVYGRVRPPAFAADPERVPGFLAVLGPDGPLGFSTSVVIREQGERPATITVEAASEGLNLRLEGTVRHVTKTRMQGAFGSSPSAHDSLLQMRVDFRGTGQVQDRVIDFNAAGSAETFRPW